VCNFPKGKVQTLKSIMDGSVSRTETLFFRCYLYMAGFKTLQNYKKDSISALRDGTFLLPLCFF
jgi:hypothetical protein